MFSLLVSSFYREETIFSKVAKYNTAGYQNPKPHCGNRETIYTHVLKSAAVPQTLVAEVLGHKESLKVNISKFIL